MKYSFAFSALAALCAAQELPWDIIQSADPPPTVTVPWGAAGATIIPYHSETAIAAVVADVVSDPLPQATDLPDLPAIVEKRDLVKRACQAQTQGNGPIPEDDSAEGFLAFSAFKEAAESAKTPNGYALNYRNLNSSSNAYGYMGFALMDSYDTESCASQCTSIYGCHSFNIFFERDPAIQPGDGCPNPKSTTLIKCVFWGGPTSTDNSKNTGFRYYGFDIVIAGSNAYDSVTAPLEEGYAAPTSLGKAQLNAPMDCGGFDTYLGSKMFTDGPFDPALCAAACTAQSEYNIANPPPTGVAQTCQFFNTYLLLKNGLPEGQVCSMYTMSWDAQYAPANQGQWRDNDHYSFAYSFTYANLTSPGSPRIPCPVVSASSVIAASTLEPYCNTLLGYTTPVSTSTQINTVTVPSTTVQSTYTRTTTITSTAKATVRITTGTPIVFVPGPTGVQALRRDVLATDVPEALQSFDADVVSSACALQPDVTPITTTSTVMATATSTVTEGQTVVVTTALFVRTTYTTVTTTATTYVPPDPTNTLWVSPAANDAGKFLKIGPTYGLLTQSNFVPEGREGFRLTSDGYLYSTTNGKWISGNIDAIDGKYGLLGLSAFADKAQARPIWRGTDNGDGTTRIHLVNPANNHEFQLCALINGIGSPLNDFKSGYGVFGYSSANLGSVLIPTIMTLRNEA
ncbi:hypothetical protein F5B22DRAFT_659634 [Xylaria bambusicola]|uniref:uncharacterized protein n=1 Tax=Xylaria bambusicola TaxID=326684 RepID=UPI0020076183|nr:uncharacterized protein F5B22DRAFT_659634 [Xylaria bambusicola]KAI0523881.1 hypothetical protein F5B22DRAFT_659634 [Xylaria bambusicola]